jgi:hypothetical protein
MRFSVGGTLGAAALAASAVGSISPAVADESPFASIYTAEVLPAGAREAEQWLTWRTGKPDEHFDQAEGQSEFEYGFSNRFLVSLYANYRWTGITPNGPGAPDGRLNTARFTGFSAEAIYQVLSPYTDPFGFALYLEPAIGAGERALEGKLLFQKNFLEDRLILAGNVNLEYAWAHEVAEDNWAHETGLEFYLGASYRFAPGWFGGVEFLNENGYAGHLLFDSAPPQTNAYFFGPALHYASQNWWATLAVYNQLPIAGNPSDEPGAISHGRLIGEERWRIRFRLGVQI